jgi:hypothetical protein
VTAETRHWDRSTLETRIADAGSRRRHEGGSPNPEEIARYRELLLDGPRPSRTVVLGMTPELRIMALAASERVVTLEHNRDAISLYRDWTPAADRRREWILRSDWFDLERLLARPVDAILGDGVFGNILTMDGHRRLLSALRAVLKPDGRIILRQAVCPRGFDPEAHAAQRQIEAFRAGRLSVAEFGFGMRLWGCYAEAYDRTSGLLDNRVVFTRYADRRADGRLTDGEWNAIQRYYYGGRNMILPQDDWESLLGECGLEFSVRPLTGRAWYSYYPIYLCRLRGESDR